MSKASDINLKVILDENKNPEEIMWKATESGKIDFSSANAFLLSIWDNKENNSLSLNLWTKDMMVEDMKILFYQTLHQMADTFETATGETEIVKDMRAFCEYFAEKMEIK
jgi:gliding motility-associated protein GldC